MSTEKIKVGITHGDINGIGYEVILKALEDSRLQEICTPIVYGSFKIANTYRKDLEMGPVPFNLIHSASAARSDANNLINVVAEDLVAEPGVASKVAGEAAFAALERATADLKDGLIDVLVTAPINKHSMQSDKWQFPGHTEYLESSLGDEGDKALMILCSDKIRVALVTTHTPIAKLSESLNRELIEEKIESFAQSLRRDFGCHHPRIAVLSLNPHAGEDGMLGSEEMEIIIPAIQAAKEKRINCYGPYASDGFFGSGHYTKFDGILAMYHDQGLAPFKTLAMESGVNFTAGLPYVRTSPDHGTGFDIVGKNLASPQSLREAIYLAIDVYRNRDRHDEATANPLVKQYVERNKKDNVVLDLSKSSDEQ